MTPIFDHISTLILAYVLFGVVLPIAQALMQQKRCEEQ